MDADVKNDARLFIDESTKMQLIIWREKIERLGIARTGRLWQSFNSMIENTANGTTVTVKFVKYGLYQEMGVGYLYKHDNGGDLPFLGKDYRIEHGLNKRKKVGPAWGGYLTSGKPRKKRRWYSKKMMRWVYVLREELARITGEQCAHVICNALINPQSVLK